MFLLEDCQQVSGARLPLPVLLHGEVALVHQRAHRFVEGNQLNCLLQFEVVYPCLEALEGLPLRLVLVEELSTHQQRMRPLPPAEHGEPFPLFSPPHQNRVRDTQMPLLPLEHFPVVQHFLNVRREEVAVCQLPILVVESAQ